MSLKFRLTHRWREMDSNLYGAFSVKEFVFGFCWFFVRSGKGPFFVPSPAIRFPERAEAVKGPKHLAQLGGLPLSGACVLQRLDG
jgi:hypothetical protein